MIPLGSCTMKLKCRGRKCCQLPARFFRLHPFAPAEQTRGYAALIGDLENVARHGHRFCRRQPGTRNAGSQGEYAGLLAIRAHQAANGEHIAIYA